MLSVEQAIQQVYAAIHPLAEETVSLDQADGRVLAREVAARCSQPPFDASAMDGYAVRASDVSQIPAELAVIGEAPAGSAFEGRLGPGQTVRIFTGGRVPEGADAVVIQEDTERLADDRVRILAPAEPGRHIRRAGMDFQAGRVGLPAGKRLSPRDIGLAAAMNVPWLTVRRRPRVALLATGDELVLPGESIGPDQLIASNSFTLAAYVRRWGGIPVHLGIARDNHDSLRQAAEAAGSADLILSSGGVSVGDHDLVREVFSAAGLKIAFWRVAMRPGKPSLFGHLGAVPFLGLPGNPVSAAVCALIFVAPALEALQGLPRGSLAPPVRQGVLGCDLAANGPRQHYMRAALTQKQGGEPPVITPFRGQDSAALSDLARAACLAIRPPAADPARAGDPIAYLPLEGV